MLFWQVVKLLELSLFPGPWVQRLCSTGFYLFKFTWSLLLIVEYGNCPESNSNRTIPKAYTSDWNVYGFSSCILITSGAIHRIDPNRIKEVKQNWRKTIHQIQFIIFYQKVAVAGENLTIWFWLLQVRNRLSSPLSRRAKIYCCFSNLDELCFWHANSWKINQVKVRHTELTLHSSKRTHSIPCAVCRAISIIVNSENLVSETWMCLYNDEPSHHCVTMANWGLLTHPINRRMLTWL